MKYQVARDWKYSDFEAEVNKLLAEGWELVGGVSLVWDVNEDSDYRTFYAQALRREENPYPFA